MALDVDMNEFDRKMAILRNTMRAAVEAETPHFTWLTKVNDKDAERIFRKRMEPLDELFGGPPSEEFEDPSPK